MTLVLVGKGLVLGFDLQKLQVRAPGLFTQEVQVDVTLPLGRTGILYIDHPKGQSLCLVLDFQGII